ncbi:MAG: CDP-glycerol:poly(glycerophosphate) glycerophosphotransferase [uncultured Solirubrobacteraceae bacterium]|uniref:CDP-glycerol:poly(Glycerophosphate) glycerophosphotransferase n=1 Tax=uncultured Solirubrobacteraceae bacterium TaxID=1162706 RepID=A0A6J4SBW9_9ACTN|nr:MAG: CDP-glycerol:poly(glycerophosphate) glycerophosphotransferase [uncultured Solirubrobacteraceae bacterium]
MSGLQPVVFASWSGRYSDNPRAIAEELHRRGAPVEQYWLLDPEQAGDVPDHVRRLAPEGEETEALLASAPFVVSNDVLAHAFAKSPETHYLQTWHGTPLKKIAHDVERPVFKEAANYETWLPRDVARWDTLLSPNRFSTEIMRGAFRFEGEVIETGYPRNDLLSSPERDAIRARVREELGIGEGVRAVLYAPTWRDADPFSLHVDLDAFEREVGGEWVMLLRAHWQVAATANVEARPGVHNVSAYQDIRDLYLAADALVTDYSSAMFDFAITGKPMLFFVYDLAQYRDETRGFYFDFEREAPGPLLAESAGVIAGLRDLDRVAERHGEAYAAFRERFCHLEDGRASARAADALLARTPAG